MASNSDPKSQENANATNPSQPMIVTLNQSPQAQPETIQGFQPQSPNQQAFQAQPQMQYQQGFQAQSPIQQQQAYGYQAQSPIQQQQVYGMQYQQQAQMQETSTCCCCIPMKTGLIVIAIVGIVIGLLHVGFLGYAFASDFYRLIYFFVIDGFMELLYVAYIIACILLIVGAITRKRPLFWPYIVVAINCVIVDIVLACRVMYEIFSAFLYLAHSYPFTRYLELHFALSVLGFIVLLSWIPVSIYFLVVVANELKRINQT